MNIGFTQPSHWHHNKRDLRHLNLKHRTIKLSEEHMGENLQNLQSERVLRYNKKQSSKEKKMIN